MDIDIPITVESEKGFPPATNTLREVFEIATENGGTSGYLFTQYLPKLENNLFEGKKLSSEERRSWLVKLKGELLSVHPMMNKEIVEGFNYYMSFQDAEEMDELSVK